MRYGLYNTRYIVNLRIVQIRVVSLLWRSFVTTELVSLGRRISADTGCAGCRVERTVLCEAHTYTAAPTSSKNAQEHQLVPSFLEVYIEVPFRKNVNGKSDFSASVPAPL